MRNKLQRTDGVGHTFKVVALPVREVVHWIGIPFVASTPVRHIEYAVNDGVAEVHIRAGHINLGAQHHFAWLNLSAVHIAEEGETVLVGAVAIRTIDTCLRGCTFLSGNFFARLLIHVSQVIENTPFSEIPKVLKVVAGIANLSPVKA